MIFRTLRLEISLNPPIGSTMPDQQQKRGRTDQDITQTEENRSESEPNMMNRKGVHDIFAGIFKRHKQYLLITTYCTPSKFLVRFVS